AALLELLQPVDPPHAVQRVVQHDRGRTAYHARMTPSSRRQFLWTTGLAALALSRGPYTLDAWQEDLWSTAADILRRIKDPVFPARDVNISAHGAKGDGTTDCGPA